MTNKPKIQKRGAILLISILVSGVALAVGFGVYNRAYKVLLFGSFWKQTQVAFAAADAGLECALYWDLHTITPPVQAACFAETPFEWSPSFPVAPATSSSWSLPSLNTDGGCVNVVVTKFDPPLASGVTTKIDARGYNDACGSTNPRRIERGLSVTY